MTTVPEPAGPPVLAAGSRGEATRNDVLAAARRRFARHAYSDVTVRDIAADAGVSAPLVMKYFGSKEQLFDAAATFEDAEPVPEGSTAELARWLVAGVLERSVGRAPDPFARAIYLSVEAPEGRDVGSVFAEQIVEPLAARLTGDDALLRAECACAALMGLAASVRLVSLRGKTPAEIARVQERYVTVVVGLLEP